MTALPPSPVELPGGRAGNYFVIHETLAAGRYVDVVPMRSAFLRSVAPERVLLRAPLRVTKLLRLRDDQMAALEAAARGRDSERAAELEELSRRSIVGSGGAILMSDEPAELRWMRELVAGARGSVLVGGFGLGIVARWLDDDPAVDRVLVVELAREVLELAYLPARRLAKAVVHVGDLHRFLAERETWPWDVAIFDTWGRTTEETWETEVVPLRRRAAALGARDVRCWCEPEMAAQVRRTLAELQGIGAARLTFSRAQWAFQVSTAADLPSDARTGRRRGEAAILERLADPEFRALADLFLSEPGSPAWEDRFGRAWEDWAGLPEYSRRILVP